MLCKNQTKKLRRHLLVGGVLCAAAFGAYSCTDKYDLDTEQPDGLNSIYGYLQEQGNYNVCLQLINDLGEAEVLSKTGSKTMFVADDNAFKDFFSNNTWNVRKYEDLTLAQKKILLYSAMIDNPYSTSMLSTAEGPIKGVVCRRASSLTKYDSVLVVNLHDTAYANSVLPDNYRFNDVREGRDSLVLFQDASMSAPLVHFNYKYISGNRLASSDIDFLYNQPAGTRDVEDVYINNAKVEEKNIFCKNGFIHKVDRVILPLDNMAEIIRKDQDTKIWSSIVERFAVPYYSRSLTDTYNQLKNTTYDKVFNKRYFSERSSDETGKIAALEQDDNGRAFEASLKFDPGWNAYACKKNGEEDMYYDMAVMIVPTDEAFNDWWNNGSGKDIQEFYKTVENTPASVLQRLINVNQLESMVASVPSRFADVLDDANDAMGITEADVKSVTLGCNGVVYKTNKVFAPKAYSSVLFPVVVDTTSLSIIETAISCMDYSAYLNSMSAEYIFLVPTNDGMLTYIDPVSYGQSKSKMWKFKLLGSSVPKYKRIAADVYDCEFDEATHKWNAVGSPKEIKEQDIRYMATSGGSFSAIDETPLRNRLEKLLDNIIVTTGYVNGKKYYRTKANSFVRIDDLAVGGKVYGGLQEKYNAPLTISKIYDKANGHAVILDGPIMGTPDNVATTISQKPEFSEFFDLLSECGVMHPNINVTNYMLTAATPYDSLGNLVDIKTQGDIGYEVEGKITGSKKTKVTYLFNNYHYTMFVPTNAAMQEAYNKYHLPTVEQIREADREQEESEDEDFVNQQIPQKMREVVLDFIKYHIVDNASFVDKVEKGAGSVTSESQKTELIFATYVEDDSTKFEIKHVSEGVDSAYLAVPKVNSGRNAWYLVKSFPSKDVQGNPTSVEVYTTQYTSGKPFKVKIDVSESGMTLTDNIGEKAHVDMHDGLHNLVASEYWISNAISSKNSTGLMKSTSDPTEFYLNTSSSVVLHAIDHPLIYADGKHKNQNGDIVPTQFEYKYKPLSSEVRTRK